MKPTKNKVFCLECGRAKMLFETEKKANTFIKFNSNEIAEQNGHAPIRSYFCIACNGWHVTSRESATPFKMSLSEKVIKNYRRIKKKEQLTE